MKKLAWGATHLVPDDALAAWGARAIIDGYGYGRSLCVLPDRRDLVVSESGLRDSFVEKLAAINPVALAEAKLVAGEVDPDVPVTIYEDASVVVCGRAAGGYFYLAAYLKAPEPGIALPRKATGDPGTAAGGPVWLKLVRKVLDGEDASVFNLLTVGPGEDGIYRESYQGADIKFPPYDESIVQVVPKSDHAEAVIRQALAELEVAAT